MNNGAIKISGYHARVALLVHSGNSPIYSGIFGLGCVKLGVSSNVNKIN